MSGSAKAVGFARCFPRLILFGDSLTEKSFGDGGWCNKVMLNFKRRCDILNRGFSGYTTAYNKVVLSSLLERDHIPSGCIVGAVILLGSNDSVRKECDKRHVPVDEYVTNLREISRIFAEEGIPVQRQVMITPPPIVDQKWLEHCKELGRDLNTSYDDVKPYASACLNVAKELGTRVVDIWTAMQERKDWEDFMDDGLHFSQKGNAFVADSVIPVLEDLLADVPQVYPDQYDIDPSNIHSSFGL